MRHEERLRSSGVAVGRRDVLFWASLSLAQSSIGCHARDRHELLHVSFDPTRELFEAIDNAARRSVPSLSSVRIKQSHGGSAKQARSVIEGLDADVVSLALGYDVDALVSANLVDRGWQSRLPFGASPFTSTIVLCVRAGNPKGIHGFEDLAREGVSVITPNPKTSGGARFNHLAAWGHAKRTRNEHAEAIDFMRRFYANVPVLDSGARGALLTFAERGIGDVLVTWESDALLAASKRPRDLVVVHPERSILAEPPVSVVDAVVDVRGTRREATSYLEYLYEPEAQAIIARSRFRPRVAVAGVTFPDLELFDVASLGGWSAVHAAHFAEDALFDQLFESALAGKTR